VVSRAAAAVGSAWWLSCHVTPEAGDRASREVSPLISRRSSQDLVSRAVPGEGGKPRAAFGLVFDRDLIPDRLDHLNP
jgi:hypothetical protein